MGGDPDAGGTATEAVIFDMDGVVTDTAGVHFEAWKAVFDAFLDRHGGAAPFTRRDYLDHVDGIPRYDGVRAFLGARGFDLAVGAPDAEGLDSVHGIGNLKNRRFNDWLRENRAPAYDDALDLIRCLRDAGTAVGVFSASRNARAVLDSAGVSELFDAIVDGADAQKLGLAPKPHPAQLVETARRLGALPQRTAVVEDAVSGVEAGARGRFGLVIGVNRQTNGAEAQRHALRANGADLVTPDLRRLVLPGGGGLRTLDRLPPVWDRLAEVDERIGGRGLAVFLDYDGTLSPIVADYRKAMLPEGTGDAIRALAARVPVAVISGRDLRDVRERVGVDEAIYAGSHGFDIAGPGGLAARPDEAEGFIDPIDRAEEELRAALDDVAGAEIERKTFSIAVHFRQVADDDVAALEKTVDGIVGRHGKLRKGRGKKVIELQPRADWDKGRAVAWLLANTRLGEGGRLPVYLGDDLTDEDAFAVLVGRGISIAVRGDARATLADYALEDSGDVRRFLGWLAERGGAEG